MKQLKFTPGITVAQLVDQMSKCGVLGAGKIGRAAELVTDMFRDPDYTVFLSLAGAIVPSGLRHLIAHLIEAECVNVIVTTGANMVHDMVESLGFKHQIGTFSAKDEQLRKANVGRIGDIYIDLQAFGKLEKWLFKLLEDLPDQSRMQISPSDLLREIGGRIDDVSSILATAAKKAVPVICPGLPDSIVGFQLRTYRQDRRLVLDTLGDITKLIDKVYASKKTGVIILGGGMPKHFTLFANTFREGVDTAVQITMDRPEPGGLSGASLEEAISWSKVRSDGKAITVICDARIVRKIVETICINNPVYQWGLTSCAFISIKVNIPV